ncbi:MAG: hypothetical protein BWY04_00889 [candidate division CPR1 bacterium ADurb.Bin160]|uniref:Uncharacterized protein n=1 Tax=candidate division CPR1 bacterium ADurb.Bin160 TaxID=1852826 RepID=A0A1V5ZM78_9BACT|nr:MAG: hypothetical protein BWY04_00889 [candidate division CPR1 bacterium ADurb.Bin160]
MSFFKLDRVIYYSMFYSFDYCFISLHLFSGISSSPSLSTSFLGGNSIEVTSGETKNSLKGSLSTSEDDKYFTSLISLMFVYFWLQTTFFSSFIILNSFAFTFILSQIL